MDIIDQIRTATRQVLHDSYQYSMDAKDILVNETKPEFEGDYTVVLFSFMKTLKKSPEILGNELGQIFINNYPFLFSGYNVIKGFLNLSITDTYWRQFLKEHHANALFGQKEKNGQKVMVEYSSPNTNKPLHMGHLRNNFLGWSVVVFKQKTAYDIVKTC